MKDILTHFTKIMLLRFTPFYIYFTTSQMMSLLAVAKIPSPTRTND
jgi:hypothetical protein